MLTVTQEINELYSTMLDPDPIRWNEFQKMQDLITVLDGKMMYLDQLNSAGQLRHQISTDRIHDMTRALCRLHSVINGVKVMLELECREAHQRDMMEQDNPILNRRCEELFTAAAQALVEADKEMALWAKPRPADGVGTAKDSIPSMAAHLLLRMDIGNKMENAAKAVWPPSTLPAGGKCTKKNGDIAEAEPAWKELPKAAPPLKS